MRAARDRQASVVALSTFRGVGKVRVSMPMGALRLTTASLSSPGRLAEFELPAMV